MCPSNTISTYPPLEREELDEVYALPYMRTYHPSYEKDGGVPAINEIKFSLISNRGCFGGCSFCALTFHQGRTIQTRSHDSIVEEAKLLTQDKDFKGYIHDVGGPTANFRHPSCEKQLTHGVCKNRQCLYPSPCKNMKVDHKDYLKLLRKLRGAPEGCWLPGTYPPWQFCDNGGFFCVGESGYP